MVEQSDWTLLLPETDLIETDLITVAQEDSETDKVVEDSEVATTSTTITEDHRLLNSAKTTETLRRVQFLDSQAKKYNYDDIKFMYSFFSHLFTLSFVNMTTIWLIMLFIKKRW